MNTTFTVASQSIIVSHASAITTGYGQKKISVEIIHNDVAKTFTATTNNMHDYDAATDLEGQEKYNALYAIIQYKIEDSIAEWLEA